MISNSGSDERGRISGGRPGDQTGSEWNIRAWYNRPWNCVLRHPNTAVRDKIAELAEKAARNNNIGYNQSNRYSYWSQLQRVSYDPSRIKTACDSDCSAGVIANTRAAGYLLGISKLKNINATYTGNMRSAFRAAGFEVLTATRYLTSDKYLLRGDILLNDAHHTATNLTNGSKSSVAPTPITGSTYTVKPGDTLSGIEIKTGCSMADLTNWNNLANPNKISVGQVLAIKQPADIYKAGRKYEFLENITIFTKPDIKSKMVMHRDIPASKRYAYKSGPGGEAQNVKGRTVTAREIIRKSSGMWMRVTRGYIRVRRGGKDRVKKV